MVRYLRLDQFRYCCRVYQKDELRQHLQVFQEEALGLKFYGPSRFECRPYYFLAFSLYILFWYPSVRNRPVPLLLAKPYLHFSSLPNQRLEWSLLLHGVFLQKVRT